MDWLAQNWFFILVFLVFIAMHFSGHVMGCGGHGGHEGHGEGERGGHEGHSEQSGGKEEEKGGHGCC